MFTFTPNMCLQFPQNKKIWCKCKQFKTALLSQNIKTEMIIISKKYMLSSAIGRIVILTTL